MIKGLHHVGVSVPDIEQALSFYEDTLGFELLWRADIDGQDAASDQVIGLTGVKAKIAMLKAGSAHIELWEYEKPNPASTTIRPCDHAITHFALEVTDIDAEFERLKGAGMTFPAAPAKYDNGSAAIYAKDPFGNTVELYQLPTP